MDLLVFFCGQRRRKNRLSQMKVSASIKINFSRVVQNVSIMSRGYSTASSQTNIKRRNKKVILRAAATGLFLDLHILTLFMCLLKCKNYHLCFYFHRFVLMYLVLKIQQNDLQKFTLKYLEMFAINLTSNEASRFSKVQAT